MALEFPAQFPFNRKPAPTPATLAPAPAAQMPEPQLQSQPEPATMAMATAEPVAIPASTLPAGMRERRRSPRQTLVAKAVIRSEAQATVIASGFLSNISMAGVGFHTRKPLAIGEKFQLRVEVGPMKWASRLRVVTCRPHGDTFDIGAEFVGNELATLARRELAA